MAADDDFAEAQGPTKLANWTWNEQRKKLLWEALTKAQQVGYLSEASVMSHLLGLIEHSTIIIPCPCGMTERMPGSFLARVLSKEPANFSRRSSGSWAKCIAKSR